MIKTLFSEWVWLSTAAAAAAPSRGKNNLSASALETFVRASWGAQSLLSRREKWTNFYYFHDES